MSGVKQSVSQSVSGAVYSSKLFLVSKKKKNTRVQISSLRQLTVCCRVETKNKIFDRREKLPTILNRRARRRLGRFLNKTEIFYIFIVKYFHSQQSVVDCGGCGGSEPELKERFVSLI